MERDEEQVAVLGGDLRRVDVVAFDLVGELDFVDEDVAEAAAGAEPVADKGAEADRIPERLGTFLVQGELQDVVRRNALREKPRLEQPEQQERLAAPADAGHDLDKPVPA